MRGRTHIDRHEGPVPDRLPVYFAAAHWYADDSIIGHWDENAKVFLWTVPAARRELMWTQPLCVSKTVLAVNGRPCLYAYDGFHVAQFMTEGAQRLTLPSHSVR